MKNIDKYAQEECKTAVIFARVSSERQETDAPIDARFINLGSGYLAVIEWRLLMNLQSYAMP